MIRRIGLAAVAASGLLASCQSYYDAPAPVPVAPKPAGIDGDWVDTRGVNTANFAGGTFTSVASDTGKVLARGSYTYRDAQNVNLAFTSLLRNTTVNAACLVVMPSQMNCTSSSGAQFTLVRKGTAPVAAPAAAMTAPTPVVKPAVQM